MSGVELAVLPVTLQSKTNMQMMIDVFMAGVLLKFYYCGILSCLRPHPVSAEHYGDFWFLRKLRPGMFCEELVHVIDQDSSRASVNLIHQTPNDLRPENTGNFIVAQPET